MIFAVIALLALAMLAPLLLVLRGRASTRGARDMALDLHRTQLRELDRDLEEGRILPAEHKIAVLEVQRRLLAAAATDEAAPRSGGKGVVIATAIVVPLVAFGLYAASGSHPYMPSVEASSPLARAGRAEALIEELRQRLTELDPTSEQARRGYILLGNVEAERGRIAAAAAAYQSALRAGFDPDLAARAAELTAQAEGKVSDATAALFRRALAAAPANAPWRAIAERRLAERK